MVRCRSSLFLVLALAGLFGCSEAPLPDQEQSSADIQQGLIIFNGSEPERANNRSAGAFFNHRKYIAWVGTDNKINVMSIPRCETDWQTDRRKTVLDEKVSDDSKGGVGLAVSLDGKRLYLTWSDDRNDHRVAVRYMTIEQTDAGPVERWSEKVHAPNSHTDDAPSIAETTTGVYVAWTDNRSHLFIAHAPTPIADAPPAGVQFDGWTQLLELDQQNHRSDFGPTLAVYRDQLIYAYTTQTQDADPEHQFDRRIVFAFIDPNNIREPLGRVQFTRHVGEDDRDVQSGPALTAVDKGLFVASRHGASDNTDDHLIHYSFISEPFFDSLMDAAVVARDTRGPGAMAGDSSDPAFPIGVLFEHGPVNTKQTTDHDPALASYPGCQEDERKPALIWSGRDGGDKWLNIVEDLRKEFEQPAQCFPFKEFKDTTDKSPAYANALFNQRRDVVVDYYACKMDDIFDGGSGKDTSTFDGTARSYHATAFGAPILARLAYEAVTGNAACAGRREALEEAKSWLASQWTVSRPGSTDRCPLGKYAGEYDVSVAGFARIYYQFALPGNNPVGTGTPLSLVPTTHTWCQYPSAFYDYPKPVERSCDMRATEVQRNSTLATHLLSNIINGNTSHEQLRLAEFFPDMEPLPPPNQMNISFPRMSGPFTKKDEGPCSLGDIRETENHLLFMQSNRLLTNQLLNPNANLVAADSPYSTQTWLLAKMRAIFSKYFYEYNASAYEDYQDGALLNLYDFTDAARYPGIKTAARMLLDLKAAHAAVTTSDLRRKVPFRRRPHQNVADSLLDNQPRSLFSFLTGMNRVIAEESTVCDYDPKNLGGFALSSYRLPDPILDRLINRAHRRGYSKIHYRNPASTLAMEDLTTPNEEAFPYLDSFTATFSDPDFLISSGGHSALNQYGGNCAIAGSFCQPANENGKDVATVVIPTGEVTRRSQSLYIDSPMELKPSGRREDGHYRYKDHQSDLPLWRKSCVGPNFACGGPVVIPPSLCSITFPDSPFTFVNYTESCTKLKAGTVEPGSGFYAAVYNSGDWGFMEVEGIRTIGGTIRSLQEFKDAVMARNGGRSWGKLQENVYTTVQGDTLRFGPLPAPKAPEFLHDANIRSITRDCSRAVNRVACLATDTPTAPFFPKPTDPRDRAFTGDFVSNTDPITGESSQYKIWITNRFTCEQIVMDYTNPTQPCYRNAQGGCYDVNAKRVSNRITDPNFCQGYYLEIPLDNACPSDVAVHYTGSYLANVPVTMTTSGGASAFAMRPSSTSGASLGVQFDYPMTTATLTRTGSVLRLTPGRYMGSVTVNSGETLILPESGDYMIAGDLMINSQSTVQMPGERVRVLATGNVTFHPQTSIRPASAELALIALGREVFIQSAGFSGAVLAPNGKITVSGAGAQLMASLWAKDVVIEPGWSIRLPANNPLLNGGEEDAFASCRGAGSGGGSIPVPTTEELCRNPVPLRSGEFSVDTRGTCFQGAALGRNGAMLSVHTLDAAGSLDLEWFGGIDQNSATCSESAATLTGNGAQLVNFVSPQGSTGNVRLVVRANGPRRIRLTAEPWQNGAGCSSRP